MSNKKRLWFHEKMMTAKIIEFNELFNEYKKDKLLEEIKVCDLQTFRLICNAMNKHSYLKCGTIFDDISFEEIKIIRTALNNRVNEILGDYAKLYDQLLKSQKHELWSGDERYKLFAYDLPPYADKKVIKTIIKLICEYLNKELTIDNIQKVSYLYNFGLDSNLVKDLPLGEYSDWETNDKSFEVRNKHKKKRCEAWYSFMNYVYKKEYEKAYDIMKKYNTDKEF